MQSKYMTIRQVSRLDKDHVVSEQRYQYPIPDSEEDRDITDVLRLMLKNISDFIRREEIPLDRGDALEVEKIVCKYPSVSGVIEVTFDDDVQGNV